jgi:hypothetical protein
VVHPRCANHQPPVPRPQPPVLRHRCRGHRPHRNVRVLQPPTVPAPVAPNNWSDALRADKASKAAATARAPRPAVLP